MASASPSVAWAHAVRLRDSAGRRS